MTSDKMTIQNKNLIKKKFVNESKKNTEQFFSLFSLFSFSVSKINNDILLNNANDKQVFDFQSDQFI